MIEILFTRKHLARSSSACNVWCMVISIVNQKGGVGKSTLTVHLAAMLRELHQDVAVYDADAQRSSSEWLKRSGFDIPFEVIDPHDLEGIPGQIVALGRNHQFVVCDGPGGLGEVTRTLLALTDLALFPIPPSYLDFVISPKRHRLTGICFSANRQ